MLAARCADGLALPAVPGTPNWTVGAWVFVEDCVPGNLLHTSPLLLRFIISACSGAYN